MDILPIVLIIWIFCGIGATFVASSRGANGCLWFGLGFILGPFGLAASFAAGENIQCPSCRQRVHPEAQKCPHCQTELGDKGMSPSPTAGVVLGVACPNCGFRNDAGWNSCFSCSEPLSTLKTTLAPRRSAPASTDLTGQIERIVELHSKGLLSDEEFRRAKAKLLE